MDPQYYSPPLLEGGGGEKALTTIHWALCRNCGFNFNKHLQYSEKTYCVRIDELGRTRTSPPQGFVFHDYEQWLPLVKLALQWCVENDYPANEAGLRSVLARPAPVVCSDFD